MLGRAISNRYRIESRLGAGGMSTVYLALDAILERRVAVKVLAEHLSGDEKFVARFRREALAAAKLIHPNIVQVYDTGVDGDLHYIVMEYVEGPSAAQLLRARRVLDPATAVEIGVQACEGLEYAHRHGIVHRDVKPGNLMTLERPGERRPAVKLTDFGIARAAEQTRITQVGSVVGTAAYLSPEQARGEEAAPPSDVYSLGVVLYQFLAGRLPYETHSLTELAIRQQSERPLSPREYSEQVPEELGWAVLRALEPEAASRYASARELGQALRRGLEGEGEPPPATEELTRRILDRAETAETRRMAAAPATGREAATPVPGPAPPAGAPPAAAAPAAGRAPRALAVAVLLAAVGASIAAIVIATSRNERGVRAHQVIERTARDQIEGLRRLVEENRR